MKPHSHWQTERDNVKVTIIHTCVIHVCACQWYKTLGMERVSQLWWPRCETSTSLLHIWEAWELKDLTQLMSTGFRGFTSNTSMMQQYTWERRKTLHTGSCIVNCFRLQPHLAIPLAPSPFAVCVSFFPFDASPACMHCTHTRASSSVHCAVDQQWQSRETGSLALLWQQNSKTQEGENRSPYVHVFV